jgi:Mg2+/Co2+ transporter CorC
MHLVIPKSVIDLLDFTDDYVRNAVINSSRVVDSVLIENRDEVCGVLIFKKIIKTKHGSNAVSTGHELYGQRAGATGERGVHHVE